MPHAKGTDVWTGGGELDYTELIGLEATAATTVGPDSTAAAVGSGGVDVLSTPSMILLMEQAAREAVEDSLPEGETTVGTRVDIRHLAATPTGERARAIARVTAVEGRRLLYRVEAFDSSQMIGEGNHERFIVNLARFMEKLQQRTGQPEGGPAGKSDGDG